MKKTFFLIVTFIFLANPSTSFAQFRTNSNIINTAVGNPAQNKNLAQTAIQLVNILNTSCGAYLRGTNINCTQGLTLSNIPFPDVALGQLVLSATNNSCEGIHTTCLQCVGFVQAAVGGTYGSVLNNGGNAKDYATNVPTGYQYLPLSSTTVQEGDIIIKTGGEFGHIAIVTKVENSTFIQVAEANYNLGGEIHIGNSAASVWSGVLRKI